MLDALHLASVASAAEAEVAGKGLALPAISEDEKAALRTVEAPLVVGEGVFLKAYVAAAMGQIPFVGPVLAALSGPLIDRGLALEKAELDKVLA